MGIRRAEFDRCFELEALEPRVMLSGEGLAVMETEGDATPRIELEADAGTDGGDKDATEGFGLISFALMTEATGPAWINAAGGDWADTANWQDGTVPAAGDEVVITGLEADAVITLNGDTPALTSLTIESGTVVINGALTSQTLTIRDGAKLELTGAGSSTISSTGLLEAGATLELGGTALLAWSAGDNVNWDGHGDMIVGTGAEFRQTGSGNINVHAGLLHVQAGGTVRVAHEWGNFFLRGGEFRLDGEFIGSGANAELVQYADNVLSGRGELSNARSIVLRGTVSPGTDEDGTGWLGIAADVIFTDLWTVHLDVLDAATTTSASMDILSITGAVSFAGAGRVTVDASAADFGAMTSGTRVGDANGLFYINGSVTGTPAITVLSGAQHTVTAAWNATNRNLDVETYSPITATWTNPAGGDWSDAANWANSRLPVAGEDVIITGLNSDATVTLNGSTPALASLSLDAGTLRINGALNTADLTLTGTATLEISGSATSTVTGDVSAGVDTSFSLNSGASLIWSGAIWQQNGFALVPSGTTFTQTAGRLELGTAEQFAVNGTGTLNINGGELVIPADTLNLYNDARFNVGAATITLNGGRIAAYNQTRVTFAAGSVLRGHGEFRVNERLDFAGTLAPGSADSRGTLQFTLGEDGVAPAITFAEGWALQLDVLGAADHDVVSFIGNVTFGAAGAIAVNATAADFIGAPNGTGLDPLVTVDGTVTGTPAVSVTGNDDHSVAANWTGSQLEATTVSTVVTEISQTVSAGLQAATATYQALLADFNLGSIDLAAQGRTPFTLPGLSLNLADTFNLRALAAQVALPAIAPSSTLELLIADLEAAGFEVTQPGAGVELRGTLVRSISESLMPVVDADAAFALPEALTAGWADTLDLAITGELSAILSQRVVFEVRDGVFHLMVEPVQTSHFYLAVSGAATVAGSVRSGGKTASVSGAIDLNYEIWLHHVTGGPTPKSVGSATIDLNATLDALALAVELEAARSADALTLITSSTDTLALAGTLTLPELRDAEGNLLTLVLTGTPDDGSDGWNLNVAGTDARLMGLTVTDWNLGADLSPTTFAGAGTLDVSFDFLRQNGTAPVAALDATFDTAGLALTGTVNGTVAIVTPGGSTYLSASDFTGLVDLATTFGGSGWTGTGLSFTAASATFGAAGTSMPGTVTDGDDADDHALTGTYDFTTQTVTTIVDQLELVADTMIRLTVAGVALRHTRNGTDEQELATVNAVPVELLFLTVAPSTGPPSLTASSLTLRTDGTLIGSGAAGLGEITLGAGITLQGAHVALDGFSFLGAEAEAGDVTLTATNATLFAGHDSGYTFTATGLSGTYDFSTSSDRLTLNAATLDYTQPGKLAFAVENAVLRPDGATIWAATDLPVTLLQFNLPGELDVVTLDAAGKLVTTGLGFSDFEAGDQLMLGGLLPLNLADVSTTFAGDTNGNGIHDEGETWQVDEFELVASGHIDFAVLQTLPFNAAVRVGETELTSSEDVVSVTLKWLQDAFVPWETGLVSLVLNETTLGTAFTLAGSVDLGRYDAGAWVNAVGGSMTLGTGAIGSDLSGGTTDEVTGTLDANVGALAVGGEFIVSVTLGDAVTLTGLNVNWTLELAATEAGLIATAFAMSGGDNAAATTTLGDYLEFTSTAVVFDLMATGTDAVMTVESAAMQMRGIGTEGFAKNFSLGADGLLKPDEGFEVGTKLSALEIFWPEWMPLGVVEAYLQWEDMAEAPNDFTLRFNLFLESNEIFGSALKVSGSIDEVVIDIGLLLDGDFPVVEIGGVSLAIEGDLGEAKINGALLMGTVRIDADGQMIAPGDMATPVADRVLWGAIQAGLEIEDIGGFEIWLGLSEYGPLQGYVKASVPVVIDPSGLTGLTLNEFRAGITFNTALPATTDARNLRVDPNFLPIGELAYNDWQDIMLAAVASQMAANAEGGSMGVLLNTFRLDGGVTIYSSYLTAEVFKIEADFAMDSTGKFFARGKLIGGDIVSTTATLYFDLSRFVVDGEAVILFLADMPSELPVFTVYGGLIFNFGVEIDPDNPPANPLEQFSITINGAWELGLPEVPAITIDGSVRFDIALNAPSLRTVVEGRANIIGLGDVVSVAGDMDLYFGEDETVELVGVIALAPGDFTVLQDLGLNFDGVAVLRFNTTAEDATRDLILPAEQTPRTFNAPAGSAGLLLEGVLSIALLEVEAYRMEGTFGFSWSGDTFDVVAAGVLTAGPTALPLLRLEAEGYLKVVFTGIDVGLAALFKLSYNEGDDVFSTVGIELGGEIEFRLNTTGEDVDYALAGSEAGTGTVDRIYLPRGPPAPDGTPAESAQAYAMVHVEGTLAVLNVITLAGVFDFAATGESIDLDYAASLTLQVADTPLLVFSADGRFRLDAAGLYGETVLTLNNDAAAATAPLGFHFNATYVLQINTTGAEQTLDGKILSAGNYARVVATGDLGIDGITLAGEFVITVNGDGLGLAATGTLSLGVGEVEFIELGYAGNLQVYSDGIFAELTLSRTADGSAAFGFGFASGASYTLAVNTTPTDRNGVPRGLGSQVIVTGTLQVGDVSLEGVYTLTGSTVGMGFAAAAALVFRDGENELFRLPVEFAIELDFPGIAERIALEVDPAELDLAIPGFDWEGSFYLEINTTPDPVDDIPAGPIFRAGFDGALTLGTLALDGAWYFDASLSRTQIGGSFDLSLGVPDAAPMITWTGAADFNLGLNGVAGYAALAVDSVVSPMAELLEGDFAFELLINTSPNELTIGDRTLPKGPLAAVKSSGTLTLGDLDFTGEFFFSAAPAGVNVTVDAAVAVTLGEAITLMEFTAVGGFTLEEAGLYAAMDLALVTQAWSEVGLEAAAGSEYRLRVNTTGQDRAVGDIELAAGNYTRIEFNGGLGVGTFSLVGDYTLTLADSTADLAVNGALEAWLPGSDSAAFRLGAVGGLRIDPAGVAAAFDLDTSLTGGSINVDGVEMPLGAEQTVSLRLNTTGEERTINSITLEAGSYFTFRTTGQVVLGGFVLSGEFGFTAADTGFALDASATFGIGVADSEFMRFTVLGEIDISAAGTFAALTLATEIGDGFDDYGFGFDAGTSFTLAFNATDSEIDGIPARSPWALRIAGVLALGDETKGAELAGSFTLTPTTNNTLLLHGETSFILNLDGSPWLDVPFEFDYEIEFPGMAFRIDLIDLHEDNLNIPGLSFEEGAFFLQFNVGEEPVEYLGETIPGGPIFQLVYEGTLNVGWAALDGEFAFSASGAGVEMAVGAALRFGDRESPFLLLGGEGAFMVDGDGFAGRLALTVTGGVDTVAGPLGGELTHELYLNTRDTAVEVAGIELAAGPMAELRSTGVLDLVGLAFDGTMITRGSAEGFSMGVDANLEIRVPVVGTTLLSIPVLGGFTIGPQGFSAALDVHPTTAFFEPVGLIFGGDASYRLRINTTGEARNENGIELEAGNYARVDATGTMQLGALSITGGYSFQAESDLLRVGVNGTAVLTVPGDGPAGGELLSTAVAGQFGIGEAGVVGALDAAVGAGAPQFALGELSLPVGAEIGSRIRLNTTGSERVIEGYTMAANETFMWEISGALTLGALRLDGLNRFTAGDDLVRLEHTGRAAILSPLAGAAEVLAGEGTVGIEINAAGAAGVASLSGAPVADGAVDLGLGLDFTAALDLRFNTTGNAVTIGDITLDAGHYFEAGVSGELLLLDQRIDGTHFVRVADGAVSLRSEGTLTFGLPDVLTMTFGIDTAFVFAADGIYGTAALTVGSSAFTAQGVDFAIDAAATPIFAVNTSGSDQSIGGTTLAANSVSVGLALDLTLFGQSFGGQSVITIDAGRDLVVLRQEGALALTAGDWSPFTFNYAGYFVFGDGGMLTNLDLILAGGAEVSGVAFNGNWNLRASTFLTPLSLPGFSVGGLDVPALAIEHSPMLRVHLDGSLALAGMTLNGEFDFEAFSDHVVLYTTFSISALGISMGGAGQLRLSEAGVVADVTLNGPNVSNAYYTLAGDYVLRLNTTGSEFDGIPANYARIAVNNAVISVPGATFRGAASIDFAGDLTLRVDGMTAALDVPMLGGASLTINGWMNSAGQFNVTGTTSLAIGNKSSFGIFGTATITISHDQGIRGAISNGDLYVPGGDYARLNGSFAASMTSFELNVEETAFVLLGGLVRLDGGFGVSWSGGLFTIWANNVTATLNIPAINQSLGFNGWLNSNGEFDLNGAVRFEIGSTGTAGLFANAVLNVSHANGVSGQLTDGRFYVPGGDYASVTGGFTATSDYLYVQVDATAFVLLGGLVRIDGGMSLELSRSGFVHAGLNNVTATLGIPGLVSSAAMNGWINSNGEFDLNAAVRIEIGSANTAGLFANALLNVSHANGVSGQLTDGRFYVPGGDYAAVTGSFTATRDYLYVQVDATAFVLLGGLVRIDGGLGLELSSTGFVHAWLNNVTATIGVPGFGSTVTMNGWLNSNGEFDLRGSTFWDFRLGGQRFASGAVEVWLRHQQGFEAWVTNGELHVPGDYARLNAYMSVSGDRFILEVSETAFTLLGGLVRVDGTFRVEITRDFMHIDIRSAVVRLGVPGFGSTFAVTGYVNSAGDFSITGTARLDIGSSTLGVDAAVALTIRDEGIAGSLSGRLYIPGDYADFSGSFEAGSWGFNLQIDRARFVLLGGVVLLDGAMLLELRGGTITLWLDRVDARIGGFINLRLSGIIRSDGFFDLDGAASLRLGHWSTVEFEGDIRLNARSDYGVRAWIDAAVYVRYQQVATLRNVFTYVGRDGFGLGLGVNFGFNDVRVGGTLTLEVRSSGLTASFSGGASLWGFGGSISGWLDSRNGTWRMSGSVGFSVGGTVGASGRIDIDVGHDRLSFRARGEAWAGFHVSVWHPTPKWRWPWSGHWDREWVGGSVRYDVGFDPNSGYFSVKVVGKTVHIRFKGGFRVWLSDVGGSTVFLDVNRNGVLDNGEPFTLADQNGNFSFDDETAAASDGEAAVVSLNDLLGPLAAFDTNANGVIDEDEGALHVAGGIDLATATTLAAATRLENGAPSGLTGRAGATVFLDRNGNATPDDDEPQVTTDELGLYTFAANAINDVSPLGLLADYDANGDGFLDETEIRLYAVNGLQPVAGASAVRMFRDANGNGTHDTGELFVDLTLDELSALGEASAAGDVPAIADTPMRIFDTNGNGEMEESEAANLVATEPAEVRVPLTAIESLATGALPLTGVEYVFADVNGNGRYDEGEPRVTPNEQGVYTFASGLARDAAAGLGRLAPFDTNGNGRIDPAEGVFVVQGGVDNDNGLTNPIAASGLASGYGSGIEQTINPLSSLQVALVDQGIGQDEADAIIAGALGLPDGISIGTFNPMADNGPDAAATEGATLGAGAALTSLVTGGAGLLGNTADASAQNTVLSSLATVLLAGRENGEGYEVVNLANPATLNTVLQQAAASTGRALDEAALNAAATVLAAVNRSIQDTVAEGGDVTRALAATKAVVLTNVGSTLGDLGAGRISADEVTAALSPEALAGLIGQVSLRPTATPTLGDLSDITARGGDRLVINLPVADSDTRLSNLRFAISAADAGVANLDAATFAYTANGWQLILPTVAVANGATTITVAVSDGATTVARQFALTLDGINNAVQLIGSLANQTLADGQTLNVALGPVFSDPDGNAAYELRPVGDNRVVTARVINGELVLTADTGLAGVAAFDLVATDDLGTATTRFSVVTYPTISVGDRIRYNAAGQAGIAVTLSAPSTQTLVLNYRAEGTVGTLVFAVGETASFIPVDPAAINAQAASVGELELGVSGDWVNGSFTVSTNTYSAVELLGLRRDVLVTVEFTLTYRFVAPTAEEAEPEAAVIVLAPLSRTAAGAGVVIVVRSDAAAAPAAAASDLAAASSLQTWERPRALAGI